MPIVLRCHQGVGPAVTGTALVAADNFSARYDLDRVRGEVRDSVERAVVEVLAAAQPAKSEILAHVTG